MSQNLTSITVSFSSSSHFGTVTITMKDNLPQYDEDFQLDMVNMSYGVAICLGALVYLVFLFFTLPKGR